MTEERNQTPFEELEQALLSSAEKLFAQLEQPAASTRLCPEPPHFAPASGGPPVYSEDSLVTTLGFGGDHFRGHVIIASSLASARPLCPPILGTVEDATTCDMFGEVGNMLLGRLKNEVLNLGVTLHIGLPSTALGQRGRPARNRDNARWHAFELPQGPVYLRLAATFEKAFSFAHVTEKNAPIGVEGDLFFF